MSQPDPIWITGVGTATALGHDLDTFTDSLLAGRSGVGSVTHVDIPQQPCRIASMVGPLACPVGYDPVDFARRSAWDQLALWCTVQALQDSGWWQHRQRVRVGIILGLGAEWLHFWEGEMVAGVERLAEPSRDRPQLLDLLRTRLELSGPVTAVAAACASGNVALAQARRWLQRGWVDVCLAGAMDRTVTPMGMAGFGNLGALSKRNDAPAAASRPFDRHRDGFVMGEGAAVCVLETASTARARRARVYAELAGTGASSDAYHMVIPGSDHEPPARAMRNALADAGVAPADIDYLNAHATSTPVGDRFEASVLQAVLGSASATVPVSSTKSMTGHLLAAASAVEAVACIGALQRQAIPPTINLDEIDPDCPLCHVPHTAQQRPLDVVVSNSFGFGGSNTCIVLRRVA